MTEFHLCGIVMFIGVVMCTHADWYARLCAAPVMVGSVAYAAYRATLVPHEHLPYAGMLWVSGFCLALGSSWALYTSNVFGDNEERSINWKWVFLGLPFIVVSIVLSNIVSGALEGR